MAHEIGPHTKSREKPQTAAAAAAAAPEADGGMLLPPFLPPTALPALPSFLHTMTDEPTTLVYDQDDDIIAAPTLLP